MSFVAWSESSQIYNDSLYWKDPLPCLDDHMSEGGLMNYSTVRSKEENIICSYALLPSSTEWRIKNLVANDLERSIATKPPERQISLKIPNGEEKKDNGTSSLELQSSLSDQNAKENLGDVLPLEPLKRTEQVVSETGLKQYDGQGNNVGDVLKTNQVKIFVENENSSNSSNAEESFSECSSTSDDSNIDLDSVSLFGSKASKPFVFTYTNSDSFNSAVVRKRKLIPLGVMGNTNSHHHQAKKSSKHGRRASRRFSRRSVNTGQNEKSDTAPSSSGRTRKRHRHDNSSVASRLSGQYDDISELSSGGVIAFGGRQGSSEKIKSPRLSATSLPISEASTSTTKSLQDLLTYKPSLKSEFDFRNTTDLTKTVKNGSQEDGSVSTADNMDLRYMNEKKNEDTTDSTLLTLRGVCCAISSLQEKLTDSNRTVKSPDHLSSRKYTGKRHPSVSPSYPILSTRTPMSPAQSPFTSPGTRSPAEPSSPNCTVKKPEVHQVNCSSDANFTTVNSGDCDMAFSIPSTAAFDSSSTFCDIMTSTDGFTGSVLYSWLSTNASDLHSQRFVQNFCDCLVRSGLLVARQRTCKEMSGKGSSSSDGKTIFNRLKFVPSQIYTWGPFSRISSNSPSKTSTYKDYAVRQVEVNPTVARKENGSQIVENGLNGAGSSGNPLAPKYSSPYPNGNDSRDSSGASSTTLSSSFASQNGFADAPLENKLSQPFNIGSPTSPSGLNSSKKLGNVWPPPRPEEDDNHKLKYSEAEHQHELMVLKRNHTEELYKITKDYETNIYEMNEEHTQDIEAMQKEANHMRQEIAYLKGRLNVHKQDMSTQTQNVAQLRLTKGIQVNLSGESLPPPPQITLPTAEDTGTSSSAPSSAPPPPPCPPPPPPPTACPPPPAAPIPPPPPCAGPPPPPGSAPPPPGLPFSKKDSPRKAPIEPKKSMKPLYWKRIQIPKKELPNNKSVWGQIEDVPIDADEVECTFCKTTTSKKSKPLSDLMTTKKKIMPAKSLETKRSQAVGIFLSSLHIEMVDLKQAILNLDTVTVDDESMKAIYELRASKKEIEEIKTVQSSQKSKKDEEKQPLDKPEKFLLSLSEIDHFEDRMYCITFRTTFNEDILAVEKELSHISNALNELVDKNTVLRVLGLILSVGNYLNGGNRTRGQADGFQLEILSKLKDVKGQRDNASYSLLSYVAWIYMKNYHEGVKYEHLICPVPSFQSIALASQVNFNDVLKELKRLQKELKECEKRAVNVIRKAEDHKQPFQDIMEDFLDTAYLNLEKQGNDCTEMQRSFKETVEFFCVKPKSATKAVEPKEFFSLWQSFCMDFHAIWKVEKQRFIKMEQQEGMKRIEESRERQQATTVVATVRRRPNSLKSRLMRSKR